MRVQNTLGHILKERNGTLNMPNLAGLGLGEALKHSSGLPSPWPKPRHGGWAVAREISKGKDTPSGHWELAGVPVPWDWHYFQNETPAFPTKIIQSVAEFVGGSLANCHASGIEVIGRICGSTFENWISNLLHICRQCFSNCCA